MKQSEWNSRQALSDSVKGVFFDVFADIDDVNYSLDLKMNDLPQWDSLGNFRFLLRLEQFFGIQFEVDEMSKLCSIQAIIETLSKRFLP